MLNTLAKLCSETKKSLKSQVRHFLDMQQMIWDPKTPELQSHHKMILQNQKYRRLSITRSCTPAEAAECRLGVLERNSASVRQYRDLFLSLFRKRYGANSSSHSTCTASATVSRLEMLQVAYRHHAISQEGPEYQWIPGPLGVLGPVPLGYWGTTAQLSLPMTGKTLPWLCSNKRPGLWIHCAQTAWSIMVVWSISGGKT